MQLSHLQLPKEALLKHSLPQEEKERERGKPEGKTRKWEKRTVGKNKKGQTQRGVKKKGEGIPHWTE